LTRASTFTSYLNVEPARNIDAAVASVEARVNAAFKRMNASAARAGTGLGGLAGQSIGPNPARIGAVVNAQNAHAVATARAARSMVLESNAARAAAKETSNLERALRLSTVAANVVQGPLGPVAGRISAIATAMRELSGVRLGFVGVAAGVTAFAQMASSAQDMKSALRPLFETQQELNVAWKQTIQIANESRTALQPVVDLYARLTLAGRQAGLTQQQITKTVDVAAKAAKLSGGTRASQEAALYQFSQGIGSGNLGGEELRSVREGAIRLAKALADGMGKGVADLKKLGTEGKLNAKVLADALASQAARIDAELAKLPQTLSSGTARLGTAFTEYINQVDEASGVTRAVSESMVLLANNLPTVISGIERLALAYAALRVAGLATSQGNRVRSLLAERDAMLQTRNATLATAREEVASSTRRVAALTAERAALQTQVAAERALASERRQGAMALARSMPRPTDMAGMIRYRQTLLDARTATNSLAVTNARLAAINTALRTANTSLATSTTAAATAQKALAASGSFLRAGLMRLIGAINPLQLAISAGIYLLIEYALREDAAAGAADRMAQSQVDLAKFVDLTTGKILEQNAALKNGQILLEAGRAKEAGENYDAGRRDIGASGQSSVISGGTMGLGVARSTVDKEIKKIVDAYAAGRATEAASSAALEALASRRPDARTKVERIIPQLSRQETLLREKQQAEAAQKALRGTATAEDLRRAQGNFTGEDPAAPDKPKVAVDDKAAAAAARKAEAARRKEEARQQAAENAADKRQDILGRYSSQSKPMVRAIRDMRELQQLVGTLLKDANGNLAPYSQEQADKDKQAIREGLQRPYIELLETQRQSTDIQKLRLKGYELEANALERALSLSESGASIGERELAVLYENEKSQLRINDAMASRQRISDAILGTAQETRAAVEDAALAAAKGEAGAGKKLISTLLDNSTKLAIKRVTEGLFSGVEGKLRGLLTGPDGLADASKLLTKYTREAATGTSTLVTANSKLEESVLRLRDTLDSVSGGLAPGASAGPTAAGIGAAGGAVGNAGKALLAAAQKNVPAVVDDAIVVTGRKLADQLGTKNLPNTADVFKTGFQEVGSKLDDKLGTKFFKGIGGAVGKAFGGAGTGMAASGIASMLGIKQSSTGAAIGGAIGSFIPIPGGDIIGGLIGGTLGAAFQKAKRASTVLGIDQYGQATGGTATGNDKETQAALTGLGGSVAAQLNQIAASMDATVGAFSVSIGKYKDSFRVKSDGSSSVGNKHPGDANLIYNGESEEEAARIALLEAIRDGAIKGISEASTRILASGQDLQRALNKATAIESVPKRLLALTDPVRAAVTDLNKEFSDLIAALKEGGASTQQFADAERLYGLERKNALEQATQQAVGALNAALEEMRSGSASPLNKRDTYNNASTTLNAFRTDLAAGKSVDQQAFLSAVGNLQNASRDLNGSSGKFFTDFNDLMSLITKARDNATVSGTDGAALPDSPFATTEVQRYLGNLQTATTDQTAIVGAKLDDIYNAIIASQFGGGYTDTEGAMRLLAAYR
jgi:tape measure domain-containing protein